LPAQAECAVHPRAKLTRSHVHFEQVGDKFVGLRERGAFDVFLHRNQRCCLVRLFHGNHGLRQGEAERSLGSRQRTVCFLRHLASLIYRLSAASMRPINFSRMSKLGGSITSTSVWGMTNLRASTRENSSAFSCERKP